MKQRPAPDAPCRNKSGFGRLTGIITAMVLIVFAGYGCDTARYDGLPADLVVMNARVMTIDREQPRAGAVAVRGERIIGVGSDEYIRQFIKEGITRVIDAGGGLVTPGFNDAHCHFSGIDLDYIDLRYITDPAIIAERVRERVAQAQPGEVIRGGRWDHELFPGAEWPAKELIDPVSPDNPVVLNRIDGHSVLVNSYVIRRSGITKETPDPPGGEIVRHPATGEPTGIFKETARRLLKTEGAQITYTEEEKRERHRRSWRNAFDMAARCGVTSVQLPPGNPGTFREFLDSGDLTVRVYAGARLSENTELYREYLSLIEQYPPEGDRLRFGYLKGFIDGTLSSATALLFEPFTDQPETSGLPQMPYEELELRVLAADRLGFQVGIHAIGDKGVHWVLDAYEKARAVNGVRDSRHRIEHASIIRLDDIPRFAELGVIASTQAVFVCTDNLYAEKRLGSERCKGVFPWRRLLDAGVHIAFGTDYAVEPLDPREGLYGALTRKNRRGLPENGWFPDQILTLDEAVALYTLGSAYAEFMENRKGKIREGYLADMTVFERDLTEAAPGEIKTIPVAFTILGGKVVFDSKTAR